MLKKLCGWLLLAVLCLVPASLSAVSVSGTVTDSVNSVAYANGTFSFTLVPGPATSFPTSESTTTQTGSLNGSGAFSGVTLGDTSIIGGGARWLAKICTASNQCFAILINVTAATTSLSTTLSAAAPAISSAIVSTPSSTQTVVPQTIFMSGGQSVDALDIKNSAGTVLFKVDNSGNATGGGGSGTGTFGSIVLNGSASGAITIQPQAAAGTYNFNLPTGAGTSGQPLLSGGGAAAAMTFGTLGVGAGGTGLTTGTSGGILGFTAAGTLASSAVLTAGQFVLGGGAGATPTTSFSVVPPVNGGFPVYNPGGTLQTASTLHAVFGTCTLGTNCTVTLTGSAAFTSATSYGCGASDFTGANAVKIVQAAGSLTITGTGTDVIQYNCVGT